MSSLPPEVNSFLQRTPTALLVKGAAGTGKTTFVLQLLSEYTGTKIYISTRVSLDEIHCQFPWLKDVLPDDCIFDAEKSYAATEEAPAHPTLPTLPQSLRKLILESPETNSLVAFDSWDSVIEILGRKVETKGDLETTEILSHKIMKSLLGIFTNLAIIGESSRETKLDFLADGVVILHTRTIDDRTVRELEIKKLRGVMINQPHYLYTLNGGRFKVLQRYEPDFSQPKIWEPTPDTDSHYSTGIPDLDSILGGGFKKGSYNVIEVGPKTTFEDYNSVIRPILLNFIAQERGMFTVLSGGDHPETLRNDLTRFLPSETFEQYVRVIDYFSTDAKAPYIMALGMRDKDEIRELYRVNVAALRGKEKKPILNFEGLDTMEYLRGGDVAIKDLLAAVARTKISQDLGIGILKPGLKLTQEMTNIADTHLKILDIHRCPCIYGIKPKTPIYAIVRDEKLGSPHVNLVPIA